MTTLENVRTGSASAGLGSVTASPAKQAFGILYAGFAALPILTGVDKFLHWLVNWDQYLAPLATRVIPISGHTFMLAVGVIEIAAGLLVIARPASGLTWSQYGSGGSSPICC